MAHDDPPRNGWGWWRENTDRRIQNLEDKKIDVLISKVEDLEDENRSLKRAFYAFAFSVVGSAVVFAFTVFQLLGTHP